MSRVTLQLYVFLALLGFAANSLLCRMALMTTSIDAGLFAAIRVSSAAVALVLGFVVWQRQLPKQGNWLAAVYLSVYLLGFSFAYRAVDTGAGALLLFGAVQLTMMSFAFIRGARFRSGQWLAITVAVIGVCVLVRPSDGQSSMLAMGLMILAGVAWGAYTLLGKSLIKDGEAKAAVSVTAGNFVRATAIVLPIVVGSVFMGQDSGPVVDTLGVLYAVLSGVLASGAGYALWYLVLPRLPVAFAAMSQLTVPVLAAMMGIVFLSEPITGTLVVSSVLVLGGVTLFMTLQRPQ